MAKPEDPAEASVNARPPRLVQRVRLDAIGERGLAEDAHARGWLPNEPIEASLRGGEVVDEDGAVSRDAHARIAGYRSGGAAAGAAHDTTRDLEAPEMRADEDAGDDADDAPRLEIEELDDAALEDVPAEDAAFDEPRGDPEGTHHPSVEPRPSAAWGRVGSRTPKVPVATLERPSTSRIELTPSPVPRVALAPATGAVDISLVPGPHAVGSRNLPTLAAQHLVGRRPRRPARAVTLPPPATAPSREPRAAFALARDVRSSKGEIVLGLTIGLGVSLLLAGLGQAYMRGDPIAEQQDPQLESVTLSARPEGAGQASQASSDGVGASDVMANGVMTNGVMTNGVMTNGVMTNTAAADGRGAALPPAQPSGSRNGVARETIARTAGDDDEHPMLARASVSKGSERVPQRAIPSRETPSRAVPATAQPQPPRATRPRSAEPALDPSEAALSTNPPSPVPSSVGQSERAAAPSAPLTPAQSAGLGLDLDF